MKDAELLLPWYVNRALGEGERNEVDQLLQEDGTARQEVEFLTAVREGVRNQQYGSPGEFGWRRLQGEIERDRRGAQGAARWWRPAMAAAALVIIVQGGVLFSLVTEQPAYKPLGEPASTGAVLQVAFKPSATEREIRQLLREVDGSLITGPSALGLYRIRLGSDDVNHIAAALERMSSATAVVEQVSRE